MCKNVIDKDKLPTIKYFLNKLRQEDSLNLENISFVCVQHLIDTTVDLFQALIDIGAKPENIFVIGKHYSNCIKVVKQLKQLGIYIHKLTPLTVLGEFTEAFNYDLIGFWEKAKSNIIKNKSEGIVILDDGGRCLQIVRHDKVNNLPIIGIEQTRAGLYNPDVFNSKIPYIDVARCAAKKVLEPSIIIEEILVSVTDKLLSMSENAVYGIIGTGVLGQALTNNLLKSGYSKIVLYDKNQDFHNKFTSKKIFWAKSIDELFLKADYIFGCTGRDITEGLDFEKIIKKNKVFISCSSEDIEFLSLLKSSRNYIKKSGATPLQDLFYKLNNNAYIKIISGGFPINFNRIKEISPRNKIQLTRGLLLAALSQAGALCHNIRTHSFSTNRIMLSPLLQKAITNIWRKHIEKDYLSEELAKFEDIHWIEKNSEGFFHKENRHCCKNLEE